MFPPRSEIILQINIYKIYRYKAIKVKKSILIKRFFMLNSFWLFSSTEHILSLVYQTPILAGVPQQFYKKECLLLKNGPK